ncbi:ComEA family DNA-binding protein [candidate division WWE3 bacterium]|nr:ComEA family DNA-binding protein [candidate division WWE3 bacterium]
MSANNYSGDKQNYLDIGFKSFIVRYRVELAASFSLIALIGSVILVKLVFSYQKPIPVVLNPSNTEIQENKGDSLTHIFIDVSGAVVSPGVYQFNQGNRIGDAIKAAGGISEEADQMYIAEKINLAQLLTDGQKVYIPFFAPTVSLPVEASDYSPSTPESKLININTGTQDELMTLPGIGKTYAQNIINGRPYTSIDELQNVSGIGERRFEQIKTLVTLY